MKSNLKWRNSINPPEVVLRIPRTEDTEDSEDPEEVVTRAEARAREDQKKAATRRSAQCIGSKREYADSLHRQADTLHHRGDYEAALVLYHRATTAYPRDPRHGVAVRRTSTAITSATNPTGALKKFLSGTKNAGHLAANYCPETAALKARRLLEESPDPVSAIDQILKYFDSRKDFWRDPQTTQDRRAAPLVPGSRIMLRQLSVMASAALQNLQATSASGDAGSTIKIGQELLAVSGALPDGKRYQVWARHYLSMAQISLGRHDRAVDQVSIMVALARESGDAVLRCRSIATLGKVHISFGHLDAAARAWEKLVPEVVDAVPKAWLLHEIGRCHLETKRPGRALETARRCLEYAEEGNSRKWLLHGKLLMGQALIDLGRLGEAIEVLRVACDAAREENDRSTMEYVKDLIDRVTGLLRRDVCPDEEESKNGVVKGEVGGWRSWSKSDDTLREGGSFGWNLCGSSGRAAKSRMVAESLAERSQTTQRGRTRKMRVRRAQRRGTDIGRVENSGLRIRSSGSGSFDLRRRVEADSVEGERRIGRDERYRWKTEDPTRRGGDVDRGDSLTSRTRVVRKAAPRNRNSGRKLEDYNGEGSQDDLLTSRTRVICKAAPRNTALGRNLEDSDRSENQVDEDRKDLWTSRTEVICKAPPRNEISGRTLEDPDRSENQVDEDRKDLWTSRTEVICKAPPRNETPGQKLEDPDEVENQIDDDQGDLLTSRTRVVGKGSPRNKNSSWKSKDPDVKGSSLDEDQIVTFGSAKSDITEISFLIDELKKVSTILDENRVNSDGAGGLFHGEIEVSGRSPIDPSNVLISETRVIGETALASKNSNRKSEDPDGDGNRLNEDQAVVSDQTSATWDVGIFKFLHGAVDVSDSRSIVRLLDRARGAEDFKGERTEEPEISISLARLSEAGVEEEDEEVDSPLSPISPASTGRTYLVDEGEKMSSSGPRSRSHDYRKTAEKGTKEMSTIDISPEGLFRSKIDSEVVANVPGMIVDAMRDSIFDEKMKRTMNVKNLSVRSSIVEFREKHNRSTNPTKSDLFDEHRSNDTRGLRAVLEEHLEDNESISTS